MKIRILSGIWMSVFAALAFTSCGDDEMIADINKPTIETSNKGQAVNFAIADGEDEPVPATRVAYDGSKTDGKWNIVWTNGDVVNIHKHNTDASIIQTASFKVERQSNANVADLKITSTDTLRWTEGVDTEELFSVVYPSSADKSNDTHLQADEVVVSYNTDQSGSYNGSNEVSYNMENLRMLGSVHSKKVDSLTFKLKPATTTLKIVVKGPSSGSIAFSSVVVQVKSKQIGTDGTVKYKYNYDNGKFEAVDIATTPNTANYVVAVTNNNGFIDLTSGKTVTVTAFIPGLEYGADDVKINLHMGGYSKGMKTKALNANGYYTINTPALPTSKGGDNWIGQLDDNVLVSSMSIPGASDGGSYESAIKNQTMSPPQLWNMGVRAFHFQNYRGTFNATATYYRGIFPTAYTSTYANYKQSSYGAILKQLYGFVKDTNEFLLVVAKHSSFQGDGIYSYADGLRDCYKQLKEEGVQFVEFRKDLTIGECRKKIVLIQYETCAITFGANMSGWDTKIGINNYNLKNSSNQDCGSVSLIDAYIQDDNHMAYNNYSDLLQALYTNMKGAKTNPDGTRTRDWTITNTAHVVTFPISDNRHTAQGAKAMMPSLQSWIAGYDNNVGIVFMPFIGARYNTNGAETNEVFGDIMYKTIIDKNFRFPLKRNN